MPLCAGWMRLGDEIHAGELEANIDRATFNRVGALLDRAVMNGSPSRGRNPNSILRGVLFCAHCGSAFTLGLDQEERPRVPLLPL